MNNADGNCLWEALIYNILYRQCIKSKTKESHRQLRKRSLDKAQIDTQNKKLPFIPDHTTLADWEHIKKDKIYETELGDICIVAASRALKRDIMVFNTCKQTGAAPITLISAEEYRGGVLGDKNPLLLAYDSVHFESIETISQQDEIRAIELAQLIKSGQYMLNNSHVQEMTKISHNTDKRNTKNEKYTKGAHNYNTHKHKCDVCKISYEAKSDLTTHNTKIHAQHECKVCKSQKYGENGINDHTKACKHKRDIKRKENDKKDAERKKAHPTYKNMYMHLTDETPDIIEKITEEEKAENKIKKKRKEERIKMAEEKRIPEKTKKLEEIYKTTSKEERMKIGQEREEKRKKR